MRRRSVKFYYDYAEEIIIISLIAISVLIVFLQIIMRFVFNSSLTWAEELARYIFIWESWLGVSIGAKHGKHIIISLVVDRIEIVKRSMINILADLCVIAICAVLIYQGIVVVDKMTAMGSFSPALKIPMGYLYASVPVGGAMMIIRSLESIYANIKFIRRNNIGKEVV